MQFNTLAHRKTLAFGTLKYSGQPYVCNTLHEVDLSAVMHLQADVLADLTPEHRNFILPKSEQDFLGFLSKKKGVVVGVLSQGKLIAQSLLFWPQDTAAKSGLTDCPNWPTSADNSAVLMGMLVHPSARGNGLQQVLHGVRYDLAAQHHRNEALCETAAANTFSTKNCLRSGAYVISTGQDPEDGCELLNFRYSNTHHPMLTDAPPLVISPLTEFNKLSEVLANDEVVGVGVMANQSLVLRQHNGWAPMASAPKLNHYPALTGAFA